MATPCLWLQTFPSKVNTVQAPGQSLAIVCTPDKTCLFRPVQGLRAAPETVTQELFQWRKQMETSTTFLLFPSLGAELYSIPHVFFFIRTAGSLKTNVFFPVSSIFIYFFEILKLKGKENLSLSKTLETSVAFVYNVAWLVWSLMKNVTVKVLIREISLLITWAVS